MTIQSVTVKKRIRLESHIVRWGAERGIIDNSSPSKQLPKLEEEFYELCEAIDANDQEEIKDAIGDMIVVLTLISEMRGLTIAECVEHAYNSIKNRKGFLNSEGIFVKETE